MKSVAEPAERAFVNEHFSVLWRSVRAFRWLSDASTEYQVIFLLSGSFTVAAGGEAFAARAPCALLAAPGDSLRAQGSRVETLSISLAPAYLLDCALRARLTRDDALITFRTHFVADDSRLSRVGSDLAEELRVEESGQEVVVMALVEQIVIQLLRRHANVRRADELELTRVGFVDRRIRRAVELMHAHLDRELPLEELAGAAYLSPFHFARLFKKVTGASPHAYLAALRIERAKTLLATTDLSITETAVRVGYSSSSHFTKAFRQATGLTPRAFRAALIRTGGGS